ncbi:response regulator transcription factor [Pseudoteredinibacter isoporae]|nr:response regulator transcription factor [Pseudoteredinibacter isoporae]NIB24744.1 response regulator transcription factor [Pseudoteredinibacter isoporae]
MAQASILLVEDDRKLAAILSEYLSGQGFHVSCVEDGAEAPEKILSLMPELVLLDLMLPNLDGLSICRQVRSQYPGKILMLTANDDDMDQVAALELGVDDYVCKPLQPRVLLARIRMLLRRPSAKVVGAPSNSTQESYATTVSPSQTEPEKERRFDGLELHLPLQRCQLNGQTIELTPGEFELLWILSSKPDEVFSREALTLAVRGIEYDGLDRTVDNRVASLRKKLAAGQSDAAGITTVRGKGYLFVSDQW